MLYANQPQRLYLYCGIIDLRKQMKGLAQVIKAEFPAAELDDELVRIHLVRQKVREDSLLARIWIGAVSLSS